MAIYLVNNIWQMSWSNPARPGYPFRKSTGIKNEIAWDEEKKVYISKADIKKKVEAMAAKKEVEQAEGKYLDVKKEFRIKFKDLCPIYLNNHARAHNKSWKISEGYQLSIENKTGLLTYFGEYYLDEIKPLIIEKYKQERFAAGLQPSSINRNLAILSSMFNKAIDWEKCSENPMKKVDLFKLKNTRLRYLEKTEIKTLLSFCDKLLFAIVTLALNTGMRKQEILDLKWIDIDFVKRFICLLDQKNGDKSYIPLNETVILILKSIKRDESCAYVFSKDGKPYHLRRPFNTALKNAKIKGANFHTLRHTFASHLAMAGVDLNTIRELMRHKTMLMTLRYAHLSKDHKSRAVEVFASQMDNIWVIPDKHTNITHSESEVENKEFKDIVSSINISI